MYTNHCICTQTNHLAIVLGFKKKKKKSVMDWKNLKLGMVIAWTIGIVKKKLFAIATCLYGHTSHNLGLD